MEEFEIVELDLTESIFVTGSMPPRSRTAYAAWRKRQGGGGSGGDGPKRGSSKKTGAKTGQSRKTKVPNRKKPNVNNPAR